MPISNFVELWYFILIRKMLCSDHTGRRCNFVASYWRASTQYSTWVYFILAIMICLASVVLGRPLLFLLKNRSKESFRRLRNPLVHLSYYNWEVSFFNTVGSQEHIFKVQFLQWIKYNWGQRCLLILRTLVIKMFEIHSKNIGTW